MITTNKNIMLTVIVCAFVVCRPCCCRSLSEERIKIGVGVSFPLSELRMGRVPGSRQWQETKMKLRNMSALQWLSYYKLEDFPTALRHS